MAMRQRLASVLSALALLLVPNATMPQTHSPADSRTLLALVIGNSAYADGPLRGADNDAIDIAKVLRGLGFEIANADAMKNLDRVQMYRAIESFMERVDRHTIAVVYYSGHGLEDDKQNYLVPTDAALETSADIPAQLVPLEWILKRLEQRDARTKIVILDACRNMPSSLRYKSWGQRGGLAQITTLEPGTRIIYAASPGMTAMPASEGQRNSVFTAALLQAINEKHPTFDQILGRAAELTRLATNNKQEPWSAGTIGISFEVAPHLSPNPLTQPRTEHLPLSSEPVRQPQGCAEISEQVVVNGVATWTKKCL